jgi:tetratricopeptide (TPR) repeat protein
MLGSSQRCRFGHLNELPDIDDAISRQRQAVALTDDEDPNKSIYLFNLGNSYELRFECIHEVEDYVAAVSAFQAATLSNASYSHLALSAARKWADLAHRNGALTSALNGYHTALAILPHVAWPGLDMLSRQEWLFRENAEYLGCCAATCAIQLGSLEEAVELLDLGRSVFWKQAESLRGDFEMLNEETPELAEMLGSISRQLDSMNFSGSFPTVEKWKVEVDHRSREAIGMERRALVCKWEELLERVREQTGFEFFLKKIPFPKLCEAAIAGQVVILNTSNYGVDALVFNATHQIKHIPLPDIDIVTLHELSADIILQRPGNAAKAQLKNYTKRYLNPALRAVWNNIVRPIFDKIDIPLKGHVVVPHDRIWWYPTGPLAFIPIHAAGCGGAIDVSRLVISSYVTTLESLFQAQKKDTLDSARPATFLGISQPNTSGQSPLPLSTKEVQGVVQVIRSGGWSEDNIVHLDGIHATVSAVSDALETCSWVHFACHGHQGPSRFFDSAIALSDGGLDLSQIASKRLVNGRFAFLSACHTASAPTYLPGEAMHLAAGLQFAGFPSVIATMWGISDLDAPKVANDTYNYLCHHGVDRCDLSEAATALNRAVASLREDNSVTVDRWAPFVHFGI